MVGSVSKGKILLSILFSFVGGLVFCFKMHFRQGFLDKIRRVPSVKKVCFEVFNSLFTKCFGRVSS